MGNAQAQTTNKAVERRKKRMLEQAFVCLLECWSVLASGLEMYQRTWACIYTKALLFA